MTRTFSSKFYRVEVKRDCMGLDQERYANSLFPTIKQINHLAMNRKLLLDLRSSNQL